MHPFQTNRAGRRGLRVLDLGIGFAAAAALLWAGVAVGQQGQKPYPLESLVPPETLFFVSFPDIGKTKEMWKETALYRIWDDPEVRYAVDTLLGNFDKYLKEFKDEFRKETEVEFDPALEILDGQLSLALVSLPDSAQPGPKIPAAALALDFGDRKAELDGLIAYVLKKMKGDNPGLKEETWSSGATSVRTFGDEEFAVHYAIAGTTLLAATTRPVMEGMLQRASDAKVPSLAKSERFQKVLGEIAPSGGAAFLLYGNVASVVQALMADIQGEEKADIDKILDATGARGLEAAGLSVTFKDGGISDRVYLHAPGAREGLLRILTPGVTSLSLLPLVPADAVAFTSLRIDLASAWDQGFEILKKADEKAWAEAREEIQKFEEKAGVKVREDLLAAIGNEVGSWSAFPEGGGILPASVTAVSLKNPEAFEAALAKLYAAAGMERREMVWMDRKIRYFVTSVEPPAEGMPGREGPPGMNRLGLDDAMGLGVLMNLSSFSAYFVEGSTLFTSNLVQTLKDAIRKRGVPGRKTLAESAAFKGMLAKIPENPGIVLYYDLKGTFYLVYNTLLPILQIGEVFLRKEMQVPFETAALPTADAIGRHLAPAVTGVADRQGGILVSSYSSTGVTTATFLGVGAAAVGAAVAIPGLLRSRGDSGEGQVKGALKSICTGQEQFRVAVCVDTNTNGAGEYGFLQELAGTSPCRTPGGLEGTTFAASPFIQGRLGLVDAQGRAVIGGYFVRVFLPGKDAALGGAMQVPAGDKELAPAQETRWCAYAWPVEWGRTGRSTFFINEMGMVFVTNTPAYSGDNGPAAGAAYAPGEKAGNLEGQVVAGQQASDGNVWMPTD